MNNTTPENKKNFGEILDALEEAEKMPPQGNANYNELTVQTQIRNASIIFALESHPGPERISASITDLNKALEWAISHNHKQLQNDALWGLYLCHSRLEKNSTAADNLITLRLNLENQRLGIKDPRDRGNAFSMYPELFNASCRTLMKSHRYIELLEAMEASKGRWIADILTREKGKVISDRDIYSTITKLPLLTQKHHFHYLSFFMNRSDGKVIIYQVLVAQNGKVYSDPPLVLDPPVLNDALMNLDPNTWGQCDECIPGIRIEDASCQLAPLVQFLSRLFMKGIIKKGEHICYTGDENLNNLPLHYLPFDNGYLIDSFSISRVHNALQLKLILENEPFVPEIAYGFMVPAAADLKDEDQGRKRLNALVQPIKTLNRYMKTSLLERESVTISKFKDLSLGNHILHFSLHGYFPYKTPKKNPFTDSGLAFSDGKTLPDNKSISESPSRFLLSPETIISNDIKLENSHVTMMACTSGLSREGIGGDALGMDWALAQAGAKSILGSHWNVGAEDACFFFNTFYRFWIKEKKSRAEAFRKTIATMRSTNGNPSRKHCWAAYSLSGDWR